jgi:hypothetical protein
MTDRLSKSDARQILTILKRLEKDLQELAQLRALLGSTGKKPEVVRWMLTPEMEKRLLDRATATPTIVEIVTPLDIDRLAEAFKKFEEFKKRLLKPEDTVQIQGRAYLKKSAWRKWALACGLSDDILSWERVPRQGYDKNGSFLYRIIARATHASTNRSSLGVGVAAKSEKAKWAHEEHDIFALAHTRAKNRAIADLVGGGEVSAEEMQSETQEGLRPHE